MVAPARAAAFQALAAISSGRADLGDALSRSRDHLADVRDRSLVTDLVTGTLRWRNRLDYQLQRLSATPLPRLDVGVLDALRLGAYQILYLDRVPVSAVVNDAVALVKQAGFGSASGFTNAILRRLARERDTLSWPTRPATVDTERDHQALSEYLAVVHSHPSWLVDRWLTRYGVAATEQWLAFNNQPPALTLVANLARVSREELQRRLQAEAVDTALTTHATHGVIVIAGRALATTTFREGFCLVQDEASQIIPELVAARPGDRVLDACASPGGKTVALAAQCGPSGMVIATDVRAKRVQLLADTLRRCEVDNAHVVYIADHGPLPFADESFQRVLVDAPCSGLGTVRRDPDIRWRRAAEHFVALAQTQIELLARLAPLVAPGGRLVYSTCSSEREENEAVVGGFLATHESFVVTRVDGLAELPGDLREMATPEGYLRTSAQHGLEAFFGAVLTRRL
ncbi:MAG TPA: 16S rRNA (cytosine(967)-C(5))-methyltransferase RsmB [Vicinamibacterales bacterium]|nr:16S rRNA (cytosine(967)-C(5))-methyltransferase RsmB [Vicinamibacterales bacterium]